MKYHPGMAHWVSREQVSSERLADQVIATWVLALSRTTRFWVGIALRHCWVDQMSSPPERIATVTELADNFQLQASLVFVLRLSITLMSEPPIGLGTEGTTVMSEAAQVPSGWASTGAGTVGPSTGPFGLRFFLRLTLVVGVVVGLGWDAARCAVGEAASSPPTPTSRKIPPTKSRSTVKNAARRTQ
ncbi:MAG: hypothetical protein V9G04_01325 [Nocardioides sp.]